VPTGRAGSPTGRVAVVTDSTAALPSGLARRAGVLVVPLDVVVDGRRALDGEIGSGELMAALARGARVSTSQPAPAAFEAVYAAAVADGASQIVSVHLSGELSGTVDAARRAAEQCAVPVHVVDSRSAAMGLGFAVLAAARLAGQERTEPASVRRRWPLRRRGSPAVAWPGADEVVARAQQVAAGGQCWFLVDSLDQLRRGGRLSAASAVLGTLLALHPVICVADGRLAVAGKVRTRRAARARLEQLGVDAVLARGSARLAVHHLGRPGPAAELASAIVSRTAGAVVEVVLAETGAVLAAHLGPGLLAVVVADA
jgi:fatty acid-binding protein DegV